jgi:ABC-type sugar transport system permease subunit/methionine-rich copper-binding protein CopC
MTAQEIRPQTVTTPAHPSFRRRVIGLIVLVAVCWGVLLTVLPSPSGDPVLVSVSPSDGETVKSPDEVRITFDRPVPAELATIQMTNPAGERIVSTRPYNPQDADEAIAVPMPKTRYEGIYSVVWSVPSSTLEPMVGSSTFSVFSATRLTAVPGLVVDRDPVVATVYTVAGSVATAALVLGVGTVFVLGVAWPEGARRRGSRRLLQYTWATMVLATLVALLLQRLPKGFRLLLSLGLLLAWAMPPLSATIVWGWMFDTDYGVVNHVLVNTFGLEQYTQHSWLIQPLSFFLVAGVIIVWGAIPFVAFALYAGLTQVPDEVLEAAQLDGAGGISRFRLIVFPYLKPIFLITTILQIIWDLKVFTQIFALQDIGGIREQTNTLGVYIYQVSIAGGDFGTGGAIAVITAVILMSISLYYVRQTIMEEEL